jgi:hypothetical protein
MDWVSWALISFAIFVSLVIVGRYIWESAFESGFNSGWQYAQDHNRTDVSVEAFPFSELAFLSF